jgi:hypothetical protein
LDVDLIAGVMSAAEPGRLSKARNKLAELAGEPVGNGFASTLKQAAVSKPIQDRVESDAILDVIANAELGRRAEASSTTAGATESETAGNTAARQKVLKEFESTLLASSLESIMPKSQDALTGGGPAAEIWRGQQILFMSQAIAERSPLSLLGMFGDAPAKPEKLTADLGAVPGDNQQGRIRSFAYIAGGQS